MKSLRDAIKFDGIKFWFRDQVIALAPKDMLSRVGNDPIPQREMNRLKNEVLGTIISGV